MVGQREDRWLRRCAYASVIAVAALAGARAARDGARAAQGTPVVDLGGAPRPASAPRADARVMSFDPLGGDPAFARAGGPVPWPPVRRGGAREATP